MTIEKKRILGKLVAAAVGCWVLTLTTAGFGASLEGGKQTGYQLWASHGKRAGTAALDLILKNGASAEKGDFIVLTNGGYAEVGGHPTLGALDGVAGVTGATRGKNTLVEVQSAPDKPLWFAVYEKDSGICAYIEVNGKTALIPGDMGDRLFNTCEAAGIKAGDIFSSPDRFISKAESGLFGGNLFRIVTITNAVVAGAPPSAVRAMAFHDHFCPGVSSGIFMANYLKARFPAGRGGYFIHSVSPWCKEDALMVMLNATPGKRRYAVSYPKKEDLAKRVSSAKDAATIAYRRLESGLWEGRVLAFDWGKRDFPKYGNIVLDKLQSDLWFLGHLDRPETFVREIKAFELPKGVSPKDWARPGVDPLKKLGLIKE